MAKKIDRSRIDAGRFELPRKLRFLTESSVDYQSVTDRDGEWSVELSASALQRLAKSKVDLKALKAEQKAALASSASELTQERTEHEETRAALAKAERRIKAVEKRLASAAPGQPGDTSQPAAAAGKRISGASGKARGSSTKVSAAPIEGAASVTPELPARKSAAGATVAKAADAALPDTSASTPAAPAPEAP